MEWAPPDDPPDRDRPTRFLMVGLPGAGKTTRAMQIEAEHAALRLTPDEWILALYGTSLDRPQRGAIRDPVETLQWQLARRALVHRCNVVLDWGFWSRVERQRYRNEAEALGARVAIVYVSAEIEELWRRIRGRPVSASGTLEITRADLELWETLFEPPTEDEVRR